jgi:hypothetical protein
MQARIRGSLVDVVVDDLAAQVFVVVAVRSAVCDLARRHGKAVRDG